MPAWFDSFVQDARLGLRHSLRKPGFLATAVFTLALGVGANTAMFSVVYGVLLKPLPFDQPDRLLSVRSSAPGIGWSRAVLAAAQYFTYREENRTFEDIAVFQLTPATVTGDGEPDQVPALMVTDGFLPLLRVTPIVGRRFTRADDAPGSPRRAILSYGFWQRRFGGRADILGHSMTVNGAPCEIVGVLPRTFSFLETGPAVLMTLGFDRANTTIKNFSFPGIARLKPGVTIEQATRDVGADDPDDFAEVRPGQRARPVVVRRRADGAGRAASVGGRDRQRRARAVGADGHDRHGVPDRGRERREPVPRAGRRPSARVRGAGGAWRRTLADRASTAHRSAADQRGRRRGGRRPCRATIRLVRATAPSALPRVEDIALDPIVLAFATVMSLAAGLLFGLLPAARLATPRVGNLNDGGRRSSDGRSRQRMRSALVVAEIALALVLLIASGLMVRTFSALRHADAGFRGGGELLTMDVSLPRASAPTPEGTLRRHEEIIERLKQVPGVRSVGLTSSVTMDGQGMSNPLIVEGFPVLEGQAVQSRRMKWISPGYFETMETRIVAGRAFTWPEVYAFAPVVVLNERLARAYWTTPAEAVGKRVRESAISPWREVVGVVADERQDGVAQDAPPIMYWPCMVKTFFGGQPFAQRSLTYIVRSPRTGDPGFLDEVRRAVRSVDSGLPLARVRTVEQIAATSMAQTSFAMVMLAIAAAVSLLLGVVGVYGVVSYVAAQRTREIGIRMALGAAPGDVAALCARHGLLLAAAGLLLGVGGAAGLSNVLSTMLFGVKATDPITYAGGAVLLGAVTTAASYLPSRRAAKMPPVAALQSDAG